MAVREVAQIGDPALRQVARDVPPDEIGSKGMRELVRDMIATMHAEDGIGIAAPQIGESLQVAVIEIDVESDRYPDLEPFPLTVLFNPRVTVVDEAEQAFWEGCLSVPGLRGEVARPRAVRVDFLDAEGRERTITAEGFLATVFQHELDHLQGVLFVDRVRDTRRLATVDNYVRFWLEPADGAAA